MGEINTWPGWECVRQLGAGSFGKVYEIQRTEGGKAYKSALKVITIPQNDSEIENAYSTGMDEKAVTQYFRSFVTDVMNEVALMADLKGYTNIVSYEDHMMVEHEGKIGWDILIRMEVLTPLQKWTSEHPLNEAEVIRLGCDMCRALELCHKSKIIHRDIKPQNIFVNKNGDFKLGDFGIARVVEKTNSVMSQKGTYTYMAPEVFQGRNYNETADIYSLGIVLYRFLNHNRTPFLPMGNINYQDQQIAQERRMSGEAIPEPALGSSKLKQAVMMTLQYDPAKRVQSAMVLKRILEQCKSEVDRGAAWSSAPVPPKVDLEATAPVSPKVDLEATAPVQPKVDSKAASVTPEVDTEATTLVRANGNASAKVPIQANPKKKTWIIGVVAAVLVFVAGLGAVVGNAVNSRPAASEASSENEQPSRSEAYGLPQEEQSGTFEAPKEDEQSNEKIEIEGELRVGCPTSVVLEGDTVMLSVGTDSFLFDNATEGLDFYSSNSSVAEIDSKGVVTAVSAGHVNLTATYDGREASCRLYVAQQPTNRYTQIVPEYERISTHPYEEVTINLTLDGSLPENFGVSGYCSGNLRMNFKWGELQGNVLPLTICALNESDQEGTVTVLVYPQDDPTNISSAATFKVKSN